MPMFGERIASETPELDEEGVRMRFVGRREGVPARLVERMEWAEEKTAGNDRIVLFVAFNYGGRAEIVDAARSFQGGSEEEFRRHLYAPEMHDPDLLIRTSGEQRSPTTCSGSAPTRSWSSATSSGPTSTAPRSRRRWASTRPASAASGRGRDAVDLFDDEMFEEEPPPPPTAAAPAAAPGRGDGRDREAGPRRAALDRLRDRDHRRRRPRLRRRDDRDRRSSACASTSR